MVNATFITYSKYGHYLKERKNFRYMKVCVCKIFSQNHKILFLLRVQSKTKKTNVEYI